MKATDRDWMKEQFVDEGKTVQEVARECGEPPWRISKWKRRHDFSEDETEEEEEDELVECPDCGEEFTSLSTHHGLSDCGE